ncbi:MAG: FAD-dependent oxidoreductase [Gammaproteobacteria bacterium]|nr:FAD-dependent oxidoreductase [Gammaproteobacteria bacterium]
MKHYDTVIVGGGISGLYSAYRLKKHNPKKSIALFETLPMLGGRIQTGSFADGFFLPAYGALRIEPDYQTETHQFIQDLQIPIKPIEQGEASSSAIPDLNALNSEEKALVLAHSDKAADILLLEFGLQKILGHQWDVQGDTLDNPKRSAALDELKKTAAHKNKPLHQQGVWNVFSDVLSYEAIEFLREKGAYYNMKNDNHNAANWIAFLLDFRLLAQSSYIPVGGMVQAIRLIEAELISLGVDFYFEHHLDDMTQQDPATTLLSFSHTSSEHAVTQFTAEHVVLAMPQYPLKKLASCFPKTIRTLLDSIMPIPILWVTATMKNPPWKLGAKPTNGEYAPIRTAHLEYKERDGESYGLAMFYCDAPWHQYWRHFVKDSVDDFEGYQYLPQVNQNEDLKNELEKTIQQHFSLQDKPSIDEWGIRDWGRPPFGAAVHFWKAGAQSALIMNELKAFALNEHSENQNIHICGEAYSEQQGFIEGAIRTANAAITSIKKAWESSAVLAEMD